MEAETDSQMKSEIGSDFSEGALDSCSMTIRVMFMLKPVKCKLITVNRQKEQNQNQNELNLQYSLNVCQHSHLGFVLFLVSPD